MSEYVQYVRCQCGQIYDLCRVQPIGRYADCTTWRTPCCKILTDDRAPGWGPRRTYEELDLGPSGTPRREVGQRRTRPMVGPNGIIDDGWLWEQDMYGGTFRRFAPGHGPGETPDWITALEAEQA